MPQALVLIFILLLLLLLFLLLLLLLAPIMSIMDPDGQKNLWRVRKLPRARRLLWWVLSFIGGIHGALN